MQSTICTAHSLSAYPVPITGTPESRWAPRTPVAFLRQTRFALCSASHSSPFPPLQAPLSSSPRGPHRSPLLKTAEYILVFSQLHSPSWYQFLYKLQFRVHTNTHTWMFTAAFHNNQKVKVGSLRMHQPQRGKPDVVYPSTGHQSAIKSNRSLIHVPYKHTM